MDPQVDAIKQCKTSLYQPLQKISKADYKINASQHKWVQPNEMQVEQTCTDLR